MFKRIILKIVYRISPEKLNSLKSRFPSLSSKIKYFVYELVNWEKKQQRLALKFDVASEGKKSYFDSIGVKSKYFLEIVTPWSPTVTGIGTYSSKFLKSMVVHANCGIRVSFLDADHQIEDGIRSFNYHIDEGIERKLPTLYMFGNGYHHWNSFKRMQVDPGVILVHDAKIPDIPIFQNSDKYFWENMSYEEKAKSYFARIPIASKGFIFHSKHAMEIVYDQLRQDQIKKYKSLVLSTGHPMVIPEISSKPHREKLAIGTFGFQSNQKNPELTYLILAKVAKNTGRQGLIVGEISRELEKLAKKIWVEEGNDLKSLEVTGSISDTEFNLKLDQVDLGIQLRRHSNGESSGPVSELLGRGKPCITTRIGSFLELDILAEYSLDPQPKYDEFENMVLKVSNMLNSKVSQKQLTLKIQKWSQKKNYETAALEIFNFLKVLSKE